MDCIFLNKEFIGQISGGARRDRTADLNTASVALSQLSYSPTLDPTNAGAGHTTDTAKPCQAG